MRRARGGPDRLPSPRATLLVERDRDRRRPTAPLRVAGHEPYPRDPAEARRLMGEAGWPDGRNLQRAATSNVEPVADALAEDLRDSLGIGVDVTIIPDEELLAAQHTLVEKVMPLPFDVLVHPWIDLSSDAPPRSSTGRTSPLTGRSGRGHRYPSSRT